MWNEEYEVALEFETTTELKRLYSKLEEVLDPSVFEYTKELREINERIDQLQNVCKHRFINPETGRCSCCGKLVVTEV